MVVSTVSDIDHDWVQCTVSNIPHPSSVLMTGAVPIEEHVVVSVQNREQIFELTKVASNEITVYNGAARLAFRHLPAHLISVGGGTLQHVDFVSQLDGIKSEHAKAVVVFVMLPPGLFLSDAVKKRVSEEWAVGGNFDQLRTWHLVVPDPALRECFADVSAAMPSVQIHEHIQEALGYRGVAAPLTMTVSCTDSGNIRHLIVPTSPTHPRRRHDGSFEIKGLNHSSLSISFEALIYKPKGSCYLEVQLDGVPITNCIENTSVPEWAADKSFVFMLANRRPTASQIGKALLLELAGESGNESSNPFVGAGSSGNLHRSASVFGNGWC